MELRTYDDIVTKVKDDCSLHDEIFISSRELLGYLNEAINDAEQAIHNLNSEDKYFKTSAYLSLVTGTANYNMPSNIYANKILRIFYLNSDGTPRYEITRIRNLDERMGISAGDGYRYDIINDEATGQPQIELLPTSRETSSTVIRLFYIRNAKRMTTSASASNVMEIPESENFIYAHMKWNVDKKRFNNDIAKCAGSKEHRDTEYQAMLENLQQMVPDDNTLIQMDLSSYQAQSGLDCLDY